MLGGMAGPPDASTHRLRMQRAPPVTDWWMIGMSRQPTIPITAA